LIDVDQDDQLYTAMMTMNENLKSYDSEKIRDYAINHFGPVAAGKKYIAVYKSCLSS